MNNFKHKLDYMMGDTSKQETNIARGVQAKLQQQEQIKMKRAWQMPVVSTIFVVALVLLIASYNFSTTISNEGQGVPYDPLEDIMEIAKQRNNNEFSAISYEQLATYPLVDSLKPLQYIDSDAFSINGQNYATVIERQKDIFNATVYGQGDVVRTMTNTSSHLPIYNTEYYEVIAVPGDRVVLQNGELKVNGKKVKSELLQMYEEQNITLAGGYDQLLNAREYVLLNRFPAADSLQPVTISPVHKIYGKVVGIADVEKMVSIYTDKELQEGYGPDDYFDLYLYDQLFRNGSMAKRLTLKGEAFSHPTRMNEYFLEASYRTVHYVTEDKVEIRYNYSAMQGHDTVFIMYKKPGTNVWQWGL